MIGRNVMQADLTNYAKSLGYEGKAVIVTDGRVVSHRNIPWMTFCEKIRDEKGRRSKEGVHRGETDIH